MPPKSKSKTKTSSMISPSTTIPEKKSSMYISDKIDQYSLKDKVESYYTSSGIYPVVDKLMRFKDDYLNISYDVFLDLFEKIYINVKYTNKLIETDNLNYIEHEFYKYKLNIYLDVRFIINEYFKIKTFNVEQYIEDVKNRGFYLNIPKEVYRPLIDTLFDGFRKLDHTLLEKDRASIKYREDIKTLFNLDKKLEEAYIWTDVGLATIDTVDVLKKVDKGKKKYHDRVSLICHETLGRNIDNMTFNGYFSKIHKSLADYMRLDVTEPDYEKKLRMVYLSEEIANLEIEKYLEPDNLYVISEYNACNIVRFNQSVISDLNFGMSSFFNENNEYNYLIILLNLYPKSKKEEVIGLKNEGSRQYKILNNKSYGTFTRLNKYYYFLMYYFQKKLQKTPISDYHRYKFLNYFRKLNYLLSIFVSRSVDIRLSYILSQKVQDQKNIDNFKKLFTIYVFGLSEDQYRHTKYKEHKNTNIISIAKTIVKKLVDAKGSEVKLDDTMDNLCIIFNKISEVYFESFSFKEFLYEIFLQFAQFYNSLINIVEVNNTVSTSTIKGNNINNLFLKVFNNYDKKVSVNNIEPSLSSNSAGPSEPIKVDGGGDPSTNVEKVHSTYLKVLSNERNSSKKRIEKRINEKKYSMFFTQDDITESIIQGVRFYHHKVKYLENINRYTDENRLSDERDYNNIDRDVIKDLPDDDNNIVIALENNNPNHKDIKLKQIIFRVPKYKIIDDKRYTNMFNQVNEIFNDFYDNTSKKKYKIDITKYSIFDLVIYRYKKFLLKVIQYHVKFIFELIDLFNKTLLNEMKKYPKHIQDLIHENIQKYIINTDNVENPSEYNKYYLKIIHHDLTRLVFSKFFDINDTNEAGYEDKTSSYNYYIRQLIKKIDRDTVSRDYSHNYNFSKLINDSNHLHDSLFRINNIDRIKFELTQTDSNSSTSLIPDIIYTKRRFISNISKYLHFLSTNSQDIVNLRLTSNQRFIKGEIIRSSRKHDFQQNIINTIEGISNILNSDIAKNEQRLTLNELNRIQRNCYNNFTHTFINYKISNIDVKLLSKEFIQDIFICIKYQLHNEFILNIIFPIIFDVFVYESKLTTKIDGKYEFDELFKDFTNKILFEKLDCFVFIDYNFGLSIMSSIEYYYNLFLCCIYSYTIYLPFYQDKKIRKTLIITKIRFDNLYKFLFNGRKLKLNTNLDCKFVSNDEFNQRYTNISTLNTSDIPSTSTTSIVSTPLSELEQVEPEKFVYKIVSNTRKNKENKQVEIPEDILKLLKLRNTVPLDVIESVNEDIPGDIEITYEDPYYQLNEEKTYFNEIHRQVLSSFIIVKSRDIGVTEELIKKGYGNILKRLQIYENTIYNQRCYQGLDTTYSFLYEPDIHYTILKYSLKEKSMYYTCGAYTHITFKICQQNMTNYPDKMSIYDGLLKQIPNFTQSNYNRVKYISFHYGTSNWKTENYQMRPNAWINVEYKDGIKDRSYNIDLDYLYYNYTSFIEFTNTLYLLFLEFARENYYDYYLNPTCSKDSSNIRFIQNDEIKQ